MSNLTKGGQTMKCQLFKIIEKQGRKKSWLASELKVSDVTLWRWANDKIKIPLEQMYSIKELLGLESIEELYKEES